jgi:hypothetical protein
LAERTIAPKLFLKNGMSILAANVRPGYLAKLKFPKGILVLNQAPADCVLAFVEDAKEMRETLPLLRTAILPDRMLWICFHKGTSKTKAHLNRDTLYA